MQRKATPWGVLAVPIIAIGVAVGLVMKLDKSEGADSAAAMSRVAVAEIERASFEKDQEKRTSALEAARETIARRGHADAALALIDEALHGPATDQEPVPGTGETPKGEWRSLLDEYDAGTGASASQRRARLADLLDRYVDDAAAVAAIRDRIRTELSSSGERVRLDRETTFADADRAASDGRFGDALDLWTSWIERAPPLSPDDDRGVAQRLSAVVEGARAAADAAAAQYESARREGRAQAAQSALDAATARLHGTGFDVWLAARGGNAITRQPGSKSAPDRPDDPATRERSKALQLLASAEDMARHRRFDEASAKMDEAAAAVTDPGMKTELSLRAGDVRSEAAFLARLLGEVGADPAKFSPVRIGDRLVRMTAATPNDVTFVSGSAAPQTQPLADVPSAVFAQFVEKSAPAKADLVPAALLLRDLGEEEAFTKWMRAGLALDDDALRTATSGVYARSIGKPEPPGGYWPHPRDAKAIVTLAEKKSIENAEKIAELKAELVKVVEKVEKTKQAKAIDTVRKAYAKLETARKNALTVIFDEVRYFYPYRDRMREYAPVQKEVNDLVQLVRDAWTDPTAAKVRNDSVLEKLRADADKLVTDILYYGGDPSDLVPRVEGVTMYLAKDLTVQTFFETQADADLLAYNARIMKYNPSVKGPTEPERKQVEITNEYRIMFGHRRAVRIHPFLVQSARGHSEDMSKLGFFDHFNKANPAKYSPDLRMKLAGYQGAGSSENIYAGSGAPESAHDGWTHSSGHHRNLLTPAWVEMGSGCSGNHWTQNFGFRIDDDWEGGVPK